MSGNKKKFHYEELVPAIGTIIHFISSVGAIVLLVIDSFNKENEKRRGLLIVVLSLLIVSGVANVYFFFRNIQYRKAMRYKDSFAKLNHAFRDIHKAMWENHSPPTEALINFCNNLAHSFSYITGKECHAAIKVFTKPVEATAGNLSDDVCVKTIARDAISGSARSVARTKSVDHPINENSDFMDILRKIRKRNGDAIFYSNDLLQENPYFNSSFKCWHDSYDPFAGKSVREKEHFWNLEYKSSIVAPICIWTNQNVNGKLERKPNLLGFLCIHSDKTGIFEPADKHIAFGSADSLVNVVVEDPTVLFQEVP